MNGEVRDEASQTRFCRRCETTKPIDDFYLKGDGQRQPMCRDCDNTKPRTRTLAKLVRIRGRHRATAELIKRHDVEFRGLLEYFTAVAADEADALARHVVDSNHGHDAAAGPLLRPGVKRAGQKSTDRIDVGRCSACVKHHDRGHACAKCGAVPGEALKRGDDGILDEIAIERACAGDPVPLSKPERVEAVRLLVARSLSDSAIGARLHITSDAVLKIRQRAGIESRLNRKEAS